MQNEIVKALGGRRRQRFDAEGDRIFVILLAADAHRADVKAVGLVVHAGKVGALKIVVVRVERRHIEREQADVQRGERRRAVKPQRVADRGVRARQRKPVRVDTDGVGFCVVEKIEINERVFEFVRRGQQVFQHGDAAVAVIVDERAGEHGIELVGVERVGHDRKGGDGRGGAQIVQTVDRQAVVVFFVVADLDRVVGQRDHIGFFAAGRGVDRAGLRLRLRLRFGACAQGFKACEHGLVPVLRGQREQVEHQLRGLAAAQFGVGGNVDVDAQTECFRRGKIIGRIGHAGLLPTEQTDAEDQHIAVEDIAVVAETSAADADDLAAPGEHINGGRVLDHVGEVVAGLFFIPDRRLGLARDDLRKKERGLVAGDRVFEHQVAAAVAFEDAEVLQFFRGGGVIVWHRRKRQFVFIRGENAERGGGKEGDRGERDAEDLS